MKFQIDTIAKEIHVLEDCQLGELISAVEAFLPEWKEYKLVTKFPHEFSNPIIITIKEEKEPVYYPFAIPITPANPYNPCEPQYRFTCGTETINWAKDIGLLNQGVYNFEMI